MPCAENCACCCETVLDFLCSYLNPTTTNMASQPLTKAQLDNMKKPEVVQYCLKIQESLFARVGNLEKAFKESEAMNAQVATLLKRIDILESSQAIQSSVSRALSREVHRNGQYLRKDTIEVHGVEESITDQDLESKICALLSMSGESVTPDDLHGCHRLKVKTHVICKFKCRKRKHLVITNRRKVQDSPSNKNRKEEKAKHDMRLGIGFGRVWLNESLSNHYGSMLWRCRMLHKQSIIDSFWFFNGRLYVKVIENGRKIEVVDDDDLAEATGVNMIEFVKQFTKRDA